MEDVCAPAHTAMFRESDPIWPPRMLWSSPVRFVASDGPTVDTEPTPGGTSLTIYRLGSRDGEDGGADGTLRVERVGDGVALRSDR